MADEYQEKMMVASGVPFTPDEEHPYPPDPEEVEMETIKAQPGGGTDLDSLDSSTNESSDADLFVTKEDGGTAWVKKSFLKIWNYIKSKIQSSSNEVAYGTCSTAAATAAKVITLDTASNWKLKKGTIVCIKFTNTNTAQNPTLNVNNSGAKSIYYNTAVLTTGSLFTAGEANRYTSYMYDGTNWVWIGSSIDRNTTYSAMSTAELTTGTATNSRVVRADYLHNGIEEIAESGDIDTADNTATFTSSDTTDANATSWTSVTKLDSGESHASIFSKMSQMFKNVRYLYKLLRGHSVGKDVPSNAVFTDTTYSVETGDYSGAIKVTPSSGSAYNVYVKNVVKHLGNAGKSNMNDVGRLYPSVGMTNLTDPGNTTDNPMSGTTKSTSWHLYFDASYGDDPNGTNAWVAQIVNKAGTPQWWVRSRSGGTITNGTAWASNWRHLVTSDQKIVGSDLKPVYINSNGAVLPTTYGFACEEIFNGYPSAAGSWQTKSLISGKKFSDYTMLCIAYMQYNNTTIVQTIPMVEFNTQTSTGSRPILYDPNDWRVQVYKVSDTQIGLVQSVVSGDAYRTRIWGLNKK